MAMPQRDNNIEQIHRLEGLIAFAEQQKDWDEVEAPQATGAGVGGMIIWNPWHGCHKVSEGCP